MKKTLLLLSISMAYIHGFSQKNFQPATIVFLNGETQTGEMNYQDWSQNPSTVQFRSGKGSNAKTFGVNDLASFEVAGSKYKQATIDLYERTDNKNNLVYGDSMNAISKTVFLQTIIAGPKSLYLYMDNVRHFYIPNGDGYKFLEYKKYRINKEMLIPDVYYLPMDHEFVATNKSFITQLKNYLNDCSINIDKNTRYDLTAIKNIYRSYYDCQGKSPEFVQGPKRLKTEIGVLGGTVSTSFGMRTTKENDIFDRMDFASSKSFAAGANVELIFPHPRGHISLNNELLYSAYKTGGFFKYNSTPVITEEYTYVFEYSYIKLNTMLRYRFFINKDAIIFANGGISNGYALTEVNEVTRVHTFNSDKTTTKGKGFRDSRKYEPGILGGFGVRFSRASLEVRAEKGYGPFKAIGHASVLRYFALLGIRIK